MSTYRPYISGKETKKIPEFTFRAVILGILLGLVFAIGNVYLGLKVGTTVSASIPAAVLSMAILRTFFKRVSILENNMVQTIASVGEGLAAGVIFTVPALFLLGEHPDLADFSARCSRRYFRGPVHDPYAPLHYRPRTWKIAFSGGNCVRGNS